jgi:ribosome-associated toxin RatA of RatAB toxin-antitoxin module
VEELKARTVVYATPETLYDFLLDFPGYSQYSEYLDHVEQDGDGGPGTTYELTFSWWKLSYTARSEVTAVDPPERIDWRICKDIDAKGWWDVTPVSPPNSADTATEIEFYVAYDPDSASPSAVDIPRLVSIEWVIEKVKPLVREEATRIVRRVVADIEGVRRDVDVEIESG